MLSDKMQTTLNEQINEEMFSSYIYLAMAAYFEDLNMAGFAHWMRMQADEETIHAMKIYDYINERGGRVKLMAIKEPPQEWDSPLAAFEAALAHEQHISGCINKLVALARKENDFPTDSFLKWFVDEQVEEEDNVGQVVDDIRRVADVPAGLFMLDRELGVRGPAAAEAGAE